MEGRSTFSGGLGEKSSISMYFLTVLGSWLVARAISAGVAPSLSILRIPSISGMLSIPSSISLGVLRLVSTEPKGMGTAGLGVPYLCGTSCCFLVIPA